MAETTQYQQLAEAVGAGASPTVPAIFEVLADEREAALLLAASPPATAAELVERCGMPAEEVEELIDGLFRKGLVFKSKKPDGLRYYRVRHLMQLHDSTAVALDPPPELLRLWKRFMDSEWDDFSRKLEEILPASVLRVVPVNVTIEPESQVLGFEDVRAMVTEANSLAVTKCSCRAIDGACGKPLDVCIQLDRAADYALERGTGRRLDTEEAIAMLEDCEREGLVHVAENKRARGLVICNCCKDCCVNWASVRSGLGKFAAPSRFLAVVDADACNGCEDCLERCFFDALDMDDDARVARVHDERCMGCGLCQVVCDPVAIAMQQVRDEEFVPA